MAANPIKSLESHYTVYMYNGPVFTVRCALPWPPYKPFFYKLANQDTRI